MSWEPPGKGPAHRHTITADGTNATHAQSLPGHNNGPRGALQPSPSSAPHDQPLTFLGSRDPPTVSQPGFPRASGGDENPGYLSMITAFKNRYIYSALVQMFKSDKSARVEEAKRRNCCKAFCSCGRILDLFECWNSLFGLNETAEELEMLLAALPPSERTLLSENSVRVYRRQRWLGESNFLIMTDPSKPGGEKLPIVSIIRMFKACCGSSMRRVCLDARYITQVELRDDWAVSEVLFEIFVLAFSIICWIVTKRSDAESDDEVWRRDLLLWLLAISIASLIIVIVVNYVNLSYFRGVRVIIDTCMPGAATVSHRLFSDHALRTENTASHTAQQYVVTMTSMFAMEARRHLQLWKHMGDNRRFALEAGKLVKSKSEGAAHAAADTGNFRPYMTVHGVSEPHNMQHIPEAKVAQYPPGNGDHRGGAVAYAAGAYGDNDQDIVQVRLSSQ